MNTSSRGYTRERKHVTIAVSVTHGTVRTQATLRARTRAAHSRGHRAAGPAACAPRVRAASAANSPCSPRATTTVTSSPPGCQICHVRAPIFVAPPPCCCSSLLRAWPPGSLPSSTPSTSSHTRARAGSPSGASASMPWPQCHPPRRPRRARRRRPHRRHLLRRRSQSLGARPSW